MSILQKGNDNLRDYDHNPNFVLCSGIDEFYIGEGQNRLEVYVGIMDCKERPTPQFDHDHNRRVKAKMERQYFIDNWLTSNNLRFAMMFKNGNDTVVNGDSFEIVAPRIIRNYVKSVNEYLSKVIIGFDGSVPSGNIKSIENGLSDLRASALGFIKPKNLIGKIQRAPRYSSGRRVLELVRGADVICGEMRRSIEGSGNLDKWLEDERMVGLWFGRKQIPLESIGIQGSVNVTPSTLLGLCRTSLTR